MGYLFFRLTDVDTVVYRNLYETEATIDAVGEEDEDDDPLLGLS
jgi:hypothetical protein